MPTPRAPVRTFCSASRFLHAVGSLHSLQSDIFFFEAQGLILHSLLPPLFRHPGHMGRFCIDANPFMNSLELKSLAPHSSTP